MAFAPASPRTLPLTPDLPGWATPRAARRLVGRLLERLRQGKTATVAKLSVVVPTTAVIAASGTSKATAAFTPSANSLLVFEVATFINTSPVPNTPTMAGGSLTWVQRSVDTYVTTVKITTFTAAVGASPASMTVTASFGGQNQSGGIGIMALEVNGADANGFVHVATLTTNTSTTPSITLTNPPASDSAVVAFIQMNGGNSITPGGGYTTSINDPNGTGQLALTDSSSPAQTILGTLGASTLWGMVAMEIQTPVVVPTVIRVMQAVHRAVGR